ncbi:diguanylate cyclase domain-containing protein [Geodermatophilus maliterrae]|uniref:Diguanylate cyclase n=1 Tax=Geodermatophilus maliterrae TaxID=3162531 RepID=A0ABV3XL75_9ACTN
MTVSTPPDEATGPCPRRAQLPAGLDVEDLDHDAELAAVVRIAAAVTGMPFATVTVLDDRSQHQVAPHGFPGATTAREESLCSVMNADAPAVRAHDDLSADPVHAANPWVDGRYARVRAYASAPWSSTARWSAPCACSTAHRTPSPRRRVRELEARLREAALHDALTGLPNRALLLDRIELALRAQERDGLAAALLYCDLDGFKGINDTLGHAAGDAALLRMATVLRGTVRPGDTVARIGGDEFVVLCPGAGTELVARALVARIERTLATPADGGPALRSSTGVALSCRGDTADSLLRRGDAAMYEVKRSRR